MAYPTLALNLLISAPGDVPDEDLIVVRRTVSQWNANMGRIVGLTVVPISWTENATAEFGQRPQAVVNDQLVDEADLAVALFYDRLGTPTGVAESGTAEEIDRLVEAGKKVAVLTNNSPRPPLQGEANQERQRLITHISELQERALVFSYADDAQLIQHLNNFLSRATAQFQQAATDAKVSDPETPTHGVWPRAEVSERQRIDSKGNLKIQREWKLVLHNTSPGPAREVDFTFPDLPEGALFTAVRDPGPVGTIPPGQEVLFPLLLALGSPSSVDCLVSWTDDTGASRETEATVRT